ncbi:response regulator transcription factor [Myxococcus sp. RHSTA-1-4]|uniref:response regulator transcription factor n=1 Tax=Myxococcus sp. RHSTA-1-4 TaxID=2874601 RepID=UPI001CC061D7|nr:response regulator transcription factor [Myxococcus sp. RHSTA-1-4]MBZ4416817.1 response regulator transcription factor [Myxococcus sp. RHSTA-1-4]
MKLLLVEDEERMARLLHRGLSEAGHQVDVCERGEDALRQAQDVPYDVVLLDWNLPDLDGLAVLRRWRERGLRTPVMLLTARGTVGEKVAGLRAGADDYLVKPFAFEELLARLEALHRRGEAGSVLGHVGPLVLDARRRVLRHGQQEQPLTGREFSLFQELASHVGEVLSRSELLAHVWGAGFDGPPNIVDVYVGYLRGKLERLGATPVVSIQAVRGVGFRLVVEAAK